MRRAVRIVALVLLVGVLIAAIPYRRQILSYATHLKGSPRTTAAFAPLPRASEAWLHLAAVGDIGDSGSRLDATAAALARAERGADYDVLALLGDNVYPEGHVTRLDELVWEPFEPVLADGTALLAILGNHDVKDGRGPAQMDALGMPGRWWAREFAADQVLIVGLDSNDAESIVQRRWLDRTLAASSARWKIVALHHPPYSAGYQGSSTEARAVFAPIFERHGVQLVLSGHDHDYQRSKVINGVTYVVSGGGSGTRRTGSASFTEVSFSWHHFLDITLFDDDLVLRAVNQDLRVADAVTIPVAVP